MAKKAGGEPTPSEATDPRAGDLQLEDPRWILLIPEYKRLAERLGSYQLATFDFTRAMVDGVIRCMRRRVVDGGCERLPPNIWATLYLGPDLSSGAVMIFPRKISDRNTTGSVYFGWKPDIDKFWLRFELPPESDPSQDKAAKDDRPPSKRGREPILTPDEIARAKVLAQAEDDEFRRLHKGRRIKQQDMLENVKAKLLRDGAPIDIGLSTLRNAIVGKS